MGDAGMLRPSLSMMMRSDRGRVSSKSIRRDSTQISAKEERELMLEALFDYIERQLTDDMKCVTIVHVGRNTQDHDATEMYEKEFQGSIRCDYRFVPYNDGDDLEAEVFKNNDRVVVVEEQKEEEEEESSEEEEKVDEDDSDEEEVEEGEHERGNDDGDDDDDDDGEEEEEEEKEETSVEKRESLDLGASKNKRVSMDIEDLSFSSSEEEEEAEKEEEKEKVIEDSEEEEKSDSEEEEVVSVPIVHEIPDSDSDEEIVDELVLSI